MSEIKSFKEIAEDVYAADRKEKQWVDPQTGKTKKRSIQTHRIQFSASKLHKAAGEKDAIPDYLLPKDEKQVQKEEHMEQLKSELFEVLSKDAAAGDWIHDFVHSDNPKFAGKSKKERIRMALGAYYAKAKQQNEGLEEGVNDRPKSTEAKSTTTSFKVETPWRKSESQTGTTIDKSGAKHTPQSRARHLARMALNKMSEETYAGLEKEPKPGLPTAMVKKSKKAVEGDTVEGWDHPHNAVKKESYEEESMSKTYTEFMEAMTATKVAPNVTRYTGGSYGNAKGAKYGNTDYDKETLDTKDDEGGEQVKRGRGRPAGSKSGARGPRIK